MSNMLWISFIIYCIFLTATSSCLDVLESCPNNDTCTFVDSCTFAVELLNSGKRKEVQNKTCGWEGNKSKVCCPSVTPVPATTTAPRVDGLAEKQDDFIDFSTNVKVQLYAFSDRNICGSVALEDRIIGGAIARPEEFPWLVRLQSRTMRGAQYLCSGSLITDRHVLTAAHCLNSPIKLLGVRLGEWNENTDVDCYDVEETAVKCIDKPIDRGIANVTVHPDYLAKNLSNDIGIITLDEPVTFTDYIRPVCLPTTNYVKIQSFSTENVRYETAGWGMTEFGMPSAVKRKVSLSAVSHKLCSNIMNDVLPDSEDLVICAGGEKGKDSCQGDSGGPLVRLITENYKFNIFLFGITSYGAKQCGLEGRPGIYTRVSHYMDWIIQNVT